MLRRLSLAFLVVLALAVPSFAQDVGPLVRANCAGITAPVANQTWCFQQSDGQLYVWDGASWNTTAPSSTPVPMSMYSHAAFPAVTGVVGIVTDTIKGFYVYYANQLFGITFDWVYARWFGMKCDDSTADTTAFQNSLGALPATGGTVVLPPGICKHAAVTWTPAGNKTIRIIGSGAYATILKYTGTGGTALGTSDGTTISRVILEHFQLLNAGTGAVGLNLNGAQKSEAHDFIIDGFTTAVVMDTVAGGDVYFDHLDNFWIKNATTGILLGQGGNTGTANKNTFTRGKFDPAVATAFTVNAGAILNRFEDNDCETANATCFNVVLGHDNLFVNNWVETGAGGTNYNIGAGSNYNIIIQASHAGGSGGFVDNGTATVVWNPRSNQFSGTPFPLYTATTWSPAFTNLTIVGSATITGSYTKIGTTVSFTIVISPVGAGTTASTAMSTYSTLPFTPAYYSVSTTISLNTNNPPSAGTGFGQIHTNGRVYTPTWAATNDPIIISGVYQST